MKLKFDLDVPAPDFEVDWDKPPTAPMLAAIRSVDGKRTPKIMRWRLLPHWAKDEKIGYSTFNACAEEFTTKPAFCDAWKRGQRCLVVTDGFYEWKKLDSKGREKQPYAIAMADDGQMVMAGLWAKWKDPKSGDEIQSCTILTTRSNKIRADLHDRMQAILDKTDWPKWLGEEPATDEELLALLRPSPDQVLKVWPVDKKVGNVRNKGAELALPFSEAAFSSWSLSGRLDAAHWRRVRAHIPLYCLQGGLSHP